MKEILNSLLFFIAPLLAILSGLRALFVYNIRLKQIYGTTLLQTVRTLGHTLVLSEEITDEPLPRNIKALCWLYGMPFIFSIEERLMQGGGGAPIDILVHCMGLKWQQKKLIKRIQSNLIVKDIVPIYILQPWDAERIGEISIPERLMQPYTEENIYEKMDTLFQKIISGKLEKGGAILHGNPGNGKTFLLRHFALKYKLPIYIVSFTPDMNNHSLIRMFSQLKGPSIVLFEDFDTYFNRREPLLKEAKFTFDTILNILDGVYSTPSGIIFCMTANQIENIDVALKERPSRFRYVIHIEEPSTKIIEKIFHSPAFNHLEKRSLDEILTIRDSNGLSG